MALFDEKVQQQLGDILGQMTDKVTLSFFTADNGCEACHETHEFLNEVSGLSPKLEVEVHDFDKEKDLAGKFGIDKIPAILLLDKDGNDTGMKFYGLPGGYEINSFISSTLEASGKIGRAHV